MASSLTEIDISALCRGDKKAWDTFVPMAASVIRSVAWRLLSASGFEQDVPDVVQEVFVRLSRENFRLLREYDHQKASLSTWIGVITNGIAIDAMRRKRQDEVPIENVPEESLGEAQLIVDWKLRLPPDVLTARQALILTLLYEHGLTTDVIANMLHIEAQTVRSQHHKAISRLRDVWQDQLR